MSLLAIDIGTSRAKAVAFSPSGEILAQCDQSFAPTFPRPSFAELDGEMFWDASRNLCRNISSRLNSDPVEAVCISSHGETFVSVDRSGQALGPAILNMDGRAMEESAWCAATLGHKHLFEVTGLVAHPMYPLPKFLWLKKHRPELFAVARFLPVTSYLLLRMKLPPFVDYSLASRFLAFDVMRRCWSAEILAAAGLAVEKLPIPVPAGSSAGKLESDAAAELGLGTGVLVVVGGHDQACAALGVGSVEDARVSDSAGTYECIAVVSRRPHLSDAALAINLNSYCHVVPDLYLNLAFFPSGIMLKWFHDLLYVDGGRDSCAEGADENTHYRWLEEHALEGPSGLSITPHLIGTCHPDFNPWARGMIWGLNLGTNRAQIYKGILEGIACELAEIMESVEGITGKFSEVFATGGGTRSPLGMKLRASLTGKRFRTRDCPEAVCLGGAILASVAAGLHPSMAKGAQEMVRQGPVFEPDFQEAAKYQQQRKRYRSLCMMGRNSSQMELNSSEESAA